MQHRFIRVSHGKWRFLGITSSMLSHLPQRLTRSEYGKTISPNSAHHHLIHLTPQSVCSSQSSLSVVTWNHRGFQDSQPCLRELIANGADIIILQDIPTITSLLFQMIIWVEKVNFSEVVEVWQSTRVSKVLPSQPLTVIESVVYTLSNLFTRDGWPTTYS